MAVMFHNTCGYCTKQVEKRHMVKLAAMFRNTCGYSTKQIAKIIRMPTALIHSVIAVLTFK